MSRIKLLVKAVLRATLIPLAALAFVTTASAHAVDRKTYPGTMCQPGPFASPGDIEYSIEGFATNAAGGSVYVVCPILYDLFDEDRLAGLRGMGHGGISVQVRVNKPDDFGLLCEGRSKDAHGVNELLLSEWNWGGAGNHVLSLNGLGTFDGGYYVLACILAPGHSIRSYAVVEH